MSMALRGLHPALRAAAEWTLAAAALNKIPVTVTSVVRGWAEQTQLRSRYDACLARGERVYPGNRNADCRYPANQPGDSSHNYGVSFDSWVPAEHQDNWDYLRRLAGFRVPENDRIHAELPNWRAWKDQLKIYR